MEVEISNVNAAGIDPSKVNSKQRNLHCEQSSLERADGSSLFSQGETKVLTSVYGPVEVKPSKVLIDKATVECVFKPKTGMPGCAEKLLERIVRNTCDTILLSSFHPRSAISIVCQVIQDSGSLLSCAINSAILALINAGLPMKCMVAAVTCCVMDDGSLKLDPNEKDEQDAKSTITLAFENKHFSVISSHTKGIYTTEEYFSCFAACREGAKTVFDFQRKSVERGLSKEPRYSHLVSEEMDQGT